MAKPITHKLAAFGPKSETFPDVTKRTKILRAAKAETNSTGFSASHCWTVGTKAARIASPFNQSVFDRCGFFGA